MTIQPLVENAIRHGLSPRAAGGLIRVSAQCVSDHLQIRVEDDGVGLSPDWQTRRSDGLGLSVTRQRLDGFYPKGQGFFDIRPRSGGGVEVELRIPLTYSTVTTHG